MNWILEHLQILIAVGAAFAYWLNQRKQEKADDNAPAERHGEFGAPAHDEAEEMERTRRIQEEIRRKIAERANGGPIAVPPPAPEPPPLFRKESTAPRPVASPLPAPDVWRRPEPVPVAAATNTAAILERQREMEEQMRALAEAKREAQRKAAVVAAHQAEAAKVSPARGDLLTDLRGARNLRRAVVLREVLGPPVAMR